MIFLFYRKVYLLRFIFQEKLRLYYSYFKIVFNPKKVNFKNVVRIKAKYETRQNVSVT